MSTAEETPSRQRRRRQYREYLRDASVTVPRSTSWRHRDRSITRKAATPNSQNIGPSSSCSSKTHYTPSSGQVSSAPAPVCSLFSSPRNFVDEAGDINREQSPMMTIAMMTTAIIMKRMDMIGNMMKAVMMIP